MKPITVLISTALLSAGLLTGCGGGSTPAAPESAGSVTSAPRSPSAPQPAGPEIVIANMAYTTPPSVSPGAGLTIVNNDSPNHTVTADANNLFDVRIAGGGGGQSTLTAPMTPGTYPFHCKYHADMHGVLTVQ